VSRRAYLDWLRGVAVLIMVEAHLFDSWTRVLDRLDRPYRWAIIVGGFSAPLFLFLAGIAVALAAGARLRKGSTPAETAALARRRAWQVLGLAFLFRLQALVISGGAFPQTLLKVDILNVMGLSMLLAAVLWTLISQRTWRSLALLATAAVFVMVTPIVRMSPLVSTLPYPVQWYFKSIPGSGAFTLFPWCAFLLVGVVVGMWLDAAQSGKDERRVVAALSVVGPLVALAGFAATFLPSIYAESTFWNGSPTFFFVRLGILMTAIPAAWVWSQLSPGWSPFRDFGVASLFVYWIHVEMVYGSPSLWLHRALTFEQAVAAYLLFCVFLFALVKAKQRLTTARITEHTNNASVLRLLRDLRGLVGLRG
jgi:uncharacterized membrane protein